MDFESVHESVYEDIQTIVKLTKIYENVKYLSCLFSRRQSAFQTIFRRAGS